MTLKLRTLSLFERQHLSNKELAICLNSDVRTINRWKADARKFLDDLELAQKENNG